MPSTPRKMEKELLKAGFKLVSDKGRGGHRRYEHPDGRTTEIPFHSGELRKGTEQAIRKEAGLK
ncbi:type II toxin-antitoxin system HicA family toxin [Secundilactobacillus muriivasis]